MDKEEFMEKALKANEEAFGQSKLSDMTDKDSTFYQGLNTPPAEPRVEAAPEIPVDPDAIPRLRTFQADVAGAVKTDNLSISRIALSEAKRRENNEVPKASSKKSPLSIILVTLGLMLIIGGIAAIGYVFFLKDREKPAPDIAIVQEKTILRFDNEAIISLKDTNRRSLQASIEKELKNPPAQDNIRHLKMTKLDGSPGSKADLFEFFSILESRAPEDLLRFLQKDFFLGINFRQGKGEPFLIITGESYENLYPRLLLWEKTIGEDLAPIFVSQKSASSTATTSFKDQIIANKDARVAINNDGSIKFFYSLVDETTVVFAESQTTFEEILRRLRERRPKVSS